MRTFTISATDAHEAALNWILAARNAERAAQDPPLPALTLDQLIRRRTRDVLDDYVRQQQTAEKVAVAAAMDDPVKAAAIKVAAGL